MPALSLGIFVLMEHSLVITDVNLILHAKTITYGTQHILGVLAHPDLSQMELAVLNAQMENYGIQP